MKYYKLQAVAGKSTYNVSKKFKTRDAAINYAFNMIPLLFEHVEEEIIKSPSTIEYVCTNMCRFTISKQIGL